MSAPALFSHLKAPSHQIKYPLRKLKPLIGLFGLAIQYIQQIMTHTCLGAYLLTVCIVTAIIMTLT